MCITAPAGEITDWWLHPIESPAGPQDRETVGRATSTTRYRQFPSSCSSPFSNVARPPDVDDESWYLITGPSIARASSAVVLEVGMTFGAPFDPELATPLSPRAARRSRRLSRPPRVAVAGENGASLKLDRQQN
jgi:hypothetical protein